MYKTLYNILILILISVLASNLSMATQKYFETLEALPLSAKYHLYSYLGRQEVGRLQQVSRGVHTSLTNPKIESVLRLWQIYAQQLQLDLEKSMPLEEIIGQIKNYYQPHTQFLICSDDLNSCLKNYRYIKFHGFVKSIPTFIASYKDSKDNLKATGIRITNEGKIETFDLYDSATIISKDGTIVVGHTVHSGPPKAFKYEIEAKNIEFFDTLNHQTGTFVNAIGHDGKNFVGCATDKENNNKTIACRWENQVIKPLPMLDDCHSSNAMAISANKIIVGFVQNNANKTMACKWEDEKTELLALPDDGRQSSSVSLGSSATHISVNGRVIVGYFGDSRSKRAVVWNGKEVKFMPMPQAYNLESLVNSISADGKIMVGHVRSRDDQKAVAIVWNENAITHLNEACDNNLAVSSNGSDIIAESPQNNFYKVHLPRYDLWKMSSF